MLPLSSACGTIDAHKSLSAVACPRLQTARYRPVAAYRTNRVSPEHTGGLGAALHYVNAGNGVKDCDVWSFYAERSGGPFPYRWPGTADYGASKFERYADDPPSFTGRRVDLLGRSLHAPLEVEPTAVVRDCLSAARTTSAKAPAKKAVVLINPEQFVGQVVWPEASPSTDILICRGSHESCSASSVRWARSVPERSLNLLFRRCGRVAVRARVRGGVRARHRS